MNGHGPFPFIIDTGSIHTYVDVALASGLGLISASVATRLRTATCNGPGQRVGVRLSAGPLVFLKMTSSRKRASVAISSNL